MQSETSLIPEGFRKDAQGRLVPESTIKPVDLLRDQLVRDLADLAKAESASLSAFKGKVMEEIRAFVDLSAERFGVRYGGQKGNLTLMSFCGRWKVQVAIADRLVFDERLQIAKQLIDSCIRAWAGGADPKIMALVTDAFQVDKSGKVSTGRILGLRRLAIEDEAWSKAMDAIAESVQVEGSKSYIRVYEREGQTDRYVPISLDLATVAEAVHVA